MLFKVLLRRRALTVERGLKRSGLQKKAALIPVFLILYSLRGTILGSSAQTYYSDNSGKLKLLNGSQGDQFYP